MTETREEVQDRYDHSGECYDSIRIENPRGTLLTRHDHALFESMLPDDLAGLKVLEFGAGTGRFTMIALDAGMNVLATDVNDSLLEQLRAKVAASEHADRCEVRKEDVFHLTLEDASMDFAFGIHIIPRFGSLQDQKDALNEIVRVLKPGGRLLFNFRNAASLLYGRIDKEHAATYDEIAAILDDAGVEILATRGKWFLNGRLINLLGAAPSRLVAAADRALWSFASRRAWDVFVLARKRS